VNESELLRIFAEMSFGCVYLALGPVAARHGSENGTVLVEQKDSIGIVKEGDVVRCCAKIAGCNLQAGTTLDSFWLRWMFHVHVQCHLMPPPTRPVVCHHHRPHQLRGRFLVVDGNAERVCKAV
jgi:hypothetical protein